MTDRRNPQHMTDTAVIAEIHKVRDEIEERAMRLAELSRTLYIQARRQGTRREYERLGDEVHALEGSIRTANRDQLPAIQERLVKLRQDRQAQQDRISAYTVFANNWTRFAGMISQGLQRSRSTDRILNRLPASTQTEPAPAPVLEPSMASTDHGRESSHGSSPLEDLIEQYGEESLHAERR